MPHTTYRRTVTNFTASFVFDVWTVKTELLAM